MSYPLGRIAPIEFGTEVAKEIRGLLDIAPRFRFAPLPRKADLVRFRNPRYRDQTIGDCVGQSGAAMAETTIRTPSPLDFTTSQPNAAIDITPLGVYYVARQKSAELGVRLGGEGAIVTHALLGVKEKGFARWETWPGTPENERAYRDKAPKSFLDAPKLMPIQDVRQLEDWQHILEFLAGGYSVWVGVSWPNGATKTDENGRFSWSGRSVGGHAVELLGYDLDAGTVTIGNSWMGAKWGVGPCVGYTDLDPVSRLFSASKLSSGESEAVVVSEVEGWAPKVRSWVEVL